MTIRSDGEVVTLVGSYIPGYKAGGPIRSVANIVAALGDEFRFKILTTDRDMGDTAPYPGVGSGRWMRVGSADVMYLPAGWNGFFRLMALLRSLDAGSVLYLNSFFSRRFSMLAMFMHWMGICKPECIVLAPRGEFSPGALGLKSKRKLLYIGLSSWLGLYQGIIWHASTPLEEADIRRIMPDIPFIQVAEILPNGSEICRSSKTGIIVTANDIPILSGRAGGTKPLKRTGQLRIVFVSRISPKKNLLFALELLQGLSGDVSFDIYGPLEDAEYWNQCKKVIDALPSNVLVKYQGMIEHENVGKTFSEHNLFLFPTLGENYGHVICEALSAGCPVLISDQTPWRHLQEEGAGWDIPLGDTERFRAVLRQCVDGGEEWFASLSTRASEYANNIASVPAVIEDSRKLFRFAISASLRT
jgi:glycosyltransferase involved in cell wall biosynthesis